MKTNKITIFAIILIAIFNQACVIKVMPQGSRVGDVISNTTTEIYNEADEVRPVIRSRVVYYRDTTLRTRVKTRTKVVRKRPQRKAAKRRPVRKSRTSYRHPSRNKVKKRKSNPPLRKTKRKVNKNQKRTKNDLPKKERKR